MITTEIKNDVKVTYHETVYEDKQLPEFYVDGTSSTDVATLEYKGRTLHLARNGEMYISIPAEDLDNPGQWVEHDINICRYTDELERFAKTDSELLDLLHLWSVEREYEIYHQNPWWELYNEDNFPDGIVCDEDFFEAIDNAIDLIKNDEEWND
jgi:hypothetical protein